jgi:MFS family permease
MAAICAASALWAFSFGLGAPLASLWLRDTGASDTLIGLNTTLYYLGIATTAGLVPAMLRRWGQSCVVAGMLVSGLTVAWLPWSGSLTAWLLFRWVNGVAGAMSLIPTETLVNRHSPAGYRARNFGLYAFAIALGWALGNFVGLQMYETMPRLAFVIGGSAGVLAGAAFFAWIPWPPEPKETLNAKATVGLGRNFLSFGGAWVQGFLEGGMIAFLSIYLLYLGLSEGKVGWLTSGIMIGAIAFQVPLAWLADRVGRSEVLVGSYLATATGLLIVPFCTSTVWLGIGLFLIGAFSGALYPLGLALLGERLPGPSLARANAWYLGINCCGSLIGPAVTGVAMDYFGKPAVFAAGEAAVLAVFCCWLAIQAHRRWSGPRRLLHHPAPVLRNVA